MIMRTRAERRHNDWKKAIRKRRVVNEIDHFDFYDNLHQYSKNKNFCSCWMCQTKTDNKNGHGSAKNWSKADMRKLEKLDYQPIDNE